MILFQYQLTLHYLDDNVWNENLSIHRMTTMEYTTDRHRIHFGMCYPEIIC